MGLLWKKICVTKILKVGYFSLDLVILHLWALALVLQNIKNKIIFWPRPLTVIEKKSSRPGANRRRGSKTRLPCFRRGS